MKKNSLSKRNIKSAVKQRYSKLINNSKRDFCCCSTSSDLCLEDKMKGNLVKLAGYQKAELKSIPWEAVENSFGCGNPLSFVEVKKGQTVLDIGSGVGIDCFIAAEKVGKMGKVIGIDFTPEMIEKASTTAKSNGYTQVEFRLGDAESIPVEDNSVDWVISNCVINLSPNKQKVFSEISRVLKPDGQFSISDIVLGDNLPSYITNSIDAWTGCIAGAIKEKDYINGLIKAGLAEITVESRIFYDKSVIEGFINYSDTTSNSETLLDNLDSKIWSAKIRGKKLPIS